MVYPLNELKAGETAEVVWIICEPYMAEHLKSLGFISNELVTCVLKGRADSMSAYLIRGRLIGLRASNAKEVLVRAAKL
ncbi:MAG: ferrous iron transport protein A [Clostridium sp.]|nr:ferrous iron transport protein A [Clostridium sp.]